MNTGTVVRDRWTCQVRDTLCSGSDVSSLGHKERHSTRGDTRGDTVQGGTQGETQCKGGHKKRHKEGHKGRHKARAQFVSVAQPCLSVASPLSTQLPLMAALVLFATNTVCICVFAAPDWLIQCKIFRIPQPWFSLLWPLWFFLHPLSCPSPLGSLR